MDTDDILLNHPHDFFRLRELAPKPNTCFVMMPFAPEFTIVYDSIVEALEGLMICRRADDLRLGQPILERILRGIATAGLVVADLTRCNPNVFYELGIAHTRTKNVLLLTRDINDVPFDLRQLFCHTYDVNSQRGLQHLKQVVRQAGEDVLALQLPQALDSSIDRTKQIVQLMRKHLDTPDKSKGLVIRIQAAISSIGNYGRMDSSDGAALEYARLLEEERQLLIQLIEAGAILQAIISPQSIMAPEMEFVRDRERRLVRLSDFLRRRDENCMRSQFVLSPFIGSNLFFVGADVLFEGHKTGLEHGFGWTAVYTDKGFLTRRIQVFDNLFESARAYTMAAYADSSADDDYQPESDRLRAAVIKAVDSAVTTLRERE